MERGIIMDTDLDKAYEAWLRAAPEDLRTASFWLHSQQETVLGQLNEIFKTVLNRYRELSDEAYGLRLVLNNISNEANYKISSVRFHPIQTDVSTLHQKITTVIKWENGMETSVTTADCDKFDPVYGIALCFMKRTVGNSSNQLRKTLRNMGIQYD